MNSNRPSTPVGVVAIVALVFGGVFWALRQTGVPKGFEPMTSEWARVSPATLPAGTVVASAADGELTAPFQVSDDAESATGRVVTLPEGAGTEACAGFATLDVEIATEGDYALWARTFWRDGCANSVAVTVDGGEPYTMGQDGVYNAWHWVPGGAYALAAGTHRLVLREREDGVAIDQILLTPQLDLTPVGAIVDDRAKADVRRFGDTFARSPGHGLGSWRTVSGDWNIEFTLDPNRIPNQYALTGLPGDNGRRGVLLVDEPAWHGLRMTFTVFASEPARFGATLTQADGGSVDILFDVGDGSSRVEVGQDNAAAQDLGDALRLGQWQTVVVSRWAWIVHVEVDGRTVALCPNVPAADARPGLVVDRGQAVFDDVEVEELHWYAEPMAGTRLPWLVGPEAEWFKNGQGDAGMALEGRKGALSLSCYGLPVCAAYVERAGDGDALPEIPGLVPAGSDSGHVLYQPELSGGGPPTSLKLTVSGRPVRLKRLAVSYTNPKPDVYRIGPYHFTHRLVDDPSDYYDFTPEETREMRQSPEADKLVREMRRTMLVGKSTAEARAMWHTESGGWAVTDGLLRGRGRDTAVRFWRELTCPFELQLRIRLRDRGSRAEIALHDGPLGADRIAIGEEGELSADGETPTAALTLPPDGEWHDVRIVSADGRIAAASGDLRAACDALPANNGGGILLRIVGGTVEFDDIEIVVPRRTDRGLFYAFDRRETDWWRDGRDAQWLDHGGIACVLASSWTSLVASDGEGYLWNKHPVSNDVLVAYYIEENSEWYGRRRNPTHVHFAYDNICTVLSVDGTEDTGYRLEVNAKQRNVTVLYRNDKEVASVRQDPSFPIRYVGEHCPYRPRTMRVLLSKRGGKIEGMVNGQVVLSYTDPEPLTVSRVGVGGYRTRANFSHIEVRSLSPAE